MAKRSGVLMITADIHTHTDYFHGKNTVQEMYQAAAQKKLQYYGFSEHTPLPEGFSCKLYRDGDMHIFFKNYIHDVLALKQETEQYNLEHKEKHPQVLLGMELDFSPCNYPYMDTLIAGYPFDYVIGTIHFIGEQSIGRWNPDEASQEEKYAFFESYYECTMQLAKYGKTDIIAHPDFVKIHCIQDFHAWLETKRALDCLHETCKVLKETNMVVEVSTGGLIKACKEIHPAPKIMELFARYQIPISFASDTHEIGTVAYEFDSLARFAQNYGYKEHVIFINRQPVQLAF